MVLRKWKTFLLFLAKDVSPKGKDICKTVSFCYLVTFLRKKYKRCQTIICENQRSVKLLDHTVQQGVIFSVSLFFRL